MSEEVKQEMYRKFVNYRDVHKPETAYVNCHNPEELWAFVDQAITTERARIVEE